jgi:hypothetical protein
MSLSAILTYYRQNTLRSILLIAFLFRFVAAIFSTGYGFHDDHLLTVEIAQSWIDGSNFSEWLPDNVKHVTTPSGHSLTYPSILCGIFWCCEKLGAVDPAVKMFIIRLIHALVSLVLIFLGYRIVEKLYDKKAAELSAWMLAILWFMPMLSVRNLVEMVCIPFLFWGIWLIMSNDKDKLIRFFWAGFVTGLAFSIRFQTSTFIGGLGLALLIRKKIMHAVMFGLGAACSILLIQGLGDTLVWGYPFAEFRGYVDYNLKYSGSYPNGPWYNFSLLAAGLLIPPVSLFVIFGFLKDWKKNLIILLPVLTFFIFHSSFPNKQERFILPVVPFIALLGTAGWVTYYRASAFWQKNKTLYRACIVFFLAVNTVLLLALSLSSSKKNRVDAMRYLSKDRNIDCFVVENSNHDGGIQMPLFYLRKQWPMQYDLIQGDSLAKFERDVDHPGACRPKYVLFMEDENIDARVNNFKKYFPGITYETTIQPSFLDEVMRWLNPVNQNQVTVIYKVN